MSISNFNSSQPSRVGDIGRELMAIAAALLSLFILMEVVLRTFDDFGYNGPNKLNLKTESGEEVYFGMPWRKTEFYQISTPNRMGLNTRDFGSRLNGDIRVAIYGGSLVEARQVTFVDSFVSQADRMLEGMHLLPIGKGGYTAAVWLPYFVARHDQNLGQEGRYPFTDAIVLTVGEKDYTDILYADHELGLRSPYLTWQVRLKYLLSKPAVAFFKERIRSVFSSISLLSFKLHNWFWADYRNAFAEPSEEQLAWLQVMMQDQILSRWQEQVDQRQLPLGLMYMGNKNDYEQWRQGKWTRWRLFAQAASDNLGIPFVDTTTYYSGETDQLFYVHDGHPTKQGYEGSAKALRDLILQMSIDQKRK